MTCYSPAIKEDIVRRLQAGLTPDEISGQTSVPKSAILRFAKELGAKQNKDIISLGRNIKELSVLSDTAQEDYVRLVLRTTALKVAAAVENLPPDYLIEHSQKLTSLLRWAQGVMAPAEEGARKPAINVGALFQRAKPQDGEIVEP